MPTHTFAYGDKREKVALAYINAVVKFSSCFIDLMGSSSHHSGNHSELSESTKNKIEKKINVYKLILWKSQQNLHVLAKLIRTKRESLNNQCEK